MQNKFLYCFLLIAVLFSATPLKAQMALYNARDIYLAASDDNKVSLYYSQNNINVADANGNTALCMAYQNGDWKSYSLLMRYGASANVSCMRAAYVYREPATVATTQTSKVAGASVISGGAGSSSGTFLGMGAIGWTTVGVLAAGGITAAALGGGGGGGGSNKCKNVDCGEHGTCNAGQCVCEEGYAGTSCENCDSEYVMQEGVCYEKIGGCERYNPSTGYCMKCEDDEKYYLNGRICELRTEHTNCKTFVENADKCESCKEEDYKKGDGCERRQNKENCEPSGYDSVNDYCYTCKEKYKAVNGHCDAITDCNEMWSGSEPKDERCGEPDITGYTCEDAGTLVNETECVFININPCDGYNATSSTGCDPSSVNTCMSGTTLKYQCTACELGYEHQSDDTCKALDCPSGTTTTCPKGYQPAKIEAYSRSQPCYVCEIINNGEEVETEAGKSPKVTYGKPITDGSYAEMGVVGANQNIYNAAGTVDENNTYSAGNSVLTVANKYYSVPVYGMYVESANSASPYMVYNAYSKDSDVHSSGSINIEQQGSYAEKIAGMGVDVNATSSKATVVNAGDNSQGTISVSYTGAGTAKVYGIETTGTAYNNKNGTVGTITTINNGNGNTFGITGGKTVYNSYGGEGVIELEVSGSGNAYGLDSASSAHNADDSSGTATGTIKITHKGSGDSYGISALGGSNAGMSNGKGTGWTIFADGGQGTGDIYGFYADGNASSGSAVNSWGGGTGYITSFAKTDTTYSNSLLTATHQKVYGMYAPNRATLINAKNDEGYDTTATIALKANASDGLYGMYSASQAYNAMSDSRDEKTNASIMVNNTNQEKGLTYGMKASDDDDASGTAYNVFDDGYNDVTATGQINVTTSSNGNTYGMYASENVYNVWAGHKVADTSLTGKINIYKTSSDGKVYGISSNGYATNAQGSALGANALLDAEIYIETASSGDAYGMKAKYAENVYITTIGDDISAAKGTIEIKHNGSGAAYGILGTSYAYNADSDSSGKNVTGTIKITHKGAGKVYGMHAQGVYNSYSVDQKATGWIILGDDGTGSGDIYGMYATGGTEADSYNAAGIGYITSFAKTDTTYSNSLLTATHQKVYGMYAENGATLYNAKNDEEYDTTATIALTAKASQGIYGMHSTSGSVYNAQSFNDNKSNGSIMIHNMYNSGSSFDIGRAYGIYTDSGDIYNADGNANGDITVVIDKSYGDHAYGIYTTSGNVYNAHGANSNGSIKVNSNGDAYGIYSKGVVYNAHSGGEGNITVDSNQDTEISKGVVGAEVYNAFGQGSVGELLVTENSGSVYGIDVTSKGYNAHSGGEGTIRIGAVYKAYGIYGLNTDGRIELYNAYEGNGLITNKDESGSILSSGSDGVYGIYGEGKNVEVYNAYATLPYDEDEEEYKEDDDDTADATGEIILEQTGDAEMIGIYAKGTESNIVRNAYNNENGTVEGTIKLVSKNNTTDIYGIKVENAGDIYNADTDNDKVATGNINITSTGGSGDIFGIGVSGDATATNAYYGTGNINITSSSTGTVYGMKGDNNITNAQYGGKGEINVTSNSSGTAYGIQSVGTVYGNDYSSSKSIINVTSGQTGTGEVYGIRSTSNSIKNAGEMTVKIENPSSTQNAYGVFSLNDSYNAYTARSVSDITVSSLGTGAVYGVYNHKGYSRNAYKGSSSATITVSGKGSDLAGIYGIYGINSVQNAFDSIGTINATTNGAGAAFGVYVEKSSVSYNSAGTGTGTINVTSTSSGAAAGMFAKVGNLYNSFSKTATGYIDVRTEGETGDAYGMYAASGNVYNGVSGQTAPSEITIYANTTNSGKAYGIYNKGTYTVANHGKISITNLKGDAYGIHSAGSVNNYGIIEIHGSNSSYNAIGIYSSGDVNNYGAIVIGGTATKKSSGGYDTQPDQNPGSRNLAYGIYYLGTAYNHGVIRIYSNYTAGGDMYYGSSPLNAPARLTNAGTFSSEQPLNFVTKGNAQVLSMPTAVWQAPAIKGDITMSSENVEEGFETTYTTTGTFDSADLSEMNLLSQSVMFDAALADNNSDVILTMKNFEDVVENDTVASFLTENYELQNNEEMFSEIKAMSSASELNKGLDQMFGKEVFSRFMFEDLTMMREMNFDMNNKLFSNDKDYFETAGSVTPFAFDGNSGSNGRYSLTSNSYGNKSIGISAAFSDIRSDDGDLHNSNHRKETSFVVSLPMGYKTHGFHLISTPKLGYAYGTYERKGFEGATYDGTIQKRIYALTNEVRYPVKLGSWTLSPSIEANFIGYQMKGHEDEDGASPLVIPNQERYSLSSGFGLYATREVEFLQNGKLSFNVGGSVYHEFLDPYEMKLGVRKMNRYVNLRDDKRGDNFGIVRTGFDFNLGDITLSGHLNSYIDNSYHSEAKLGLKYAF